MTPLPDAFILLTGGSGTRMGGVDKAALTIDGQTLLDHALSVIGHRPTVVVGPSVPAAPLVISTLEDPPGGGPAAGTAAGVAAVTIAWRHWRGSHPAVPGDPLIALWAIDQVGVGRATWRRLAAAARPTRQAATAGGAILASPGRRHFGVGVFPLTDLARACSEQPDWHGQALRRLLEPIIAAEVEARHDEERDIDTVEDLRWWRAKGLRLGASDERNSR